MYTPFDVEQMVEALPVAIVMTNDARQILAANQAALDLFAYNREALLGKEVEVLMPDRFATNHPAQYQEYSHRPATRQMGHGRDLAARRSDGQEFPVEVGLTVLPTEPRCYLASIVDLTLRKEAESLLREKQELLESDLLQTRKQLEEQVAASTRLEERQRLGRELHDSLSQNLYSIGLGVRTAKAKVGRGDDPGEALDYCLHLTESALVEMRALLFKLRPQSLENVPLADVLESHAKAVAARTHLKISFEHQKRCAGELDFDRKYALYRIATEALHNCLKHALDGSKVEITLHSEPDQVQLTVSDDGSGFPSDITQGHGMQTMKERAEATRGTLEVLTSAQGTTIRASIPRT